MKFRKTLVCGMAGLFCMALLAGALPVFAEETDSSGAQTGDGAGTVQGDGTQAVPTVEAGDGQTPEDGQTQGGNTQEDLTQMVLASDPAAAGAPLAFAPYEPETQYTEVFPFKADQLFSGIYRTYGFYFNVEDYWDTVYAYAQIEFSVSPLIENVPASLTFAVNATPVYSCRVDYQNGKTQVAYVEIPVELLKEGYNELSLTGYVRLYDDNGCLDDFSGANWVNVSKNSLVQVGYNVADTANALCYYPYPFVSTMDSTGASCAVYVPREATDEELAAALLLRADLGGETDAEDAIALRTLDSYGADGATRRVVVALRSNLPAQILPYVDAGGKDLSQNAGVTEFTDETGGTVLVVTSDAPEALYEGAAMLLDESRVSQEVTPSAYVALGSADTKVQSTKLSDLTAENYTVKGITGGGLSFVGPFRQEQEIYLPLDGGFVLAEGGKVSLNFRYSDNLDFSRSLVTVYWGSVPVCSKKLEQEKAGGDTLSFLMPADVVGTYAGSIKVAFDLELEDLYCTKRADQMPWAYVTGDSTLYLPAGQAGKYSFELRPYPFQTLGLFNSTCVVTPDAMTDVELNTLGRVISMESSGLSPYGSLKVARASAFDAKNTDANLILIGTYADNAALAALNDKLSFAYAEGGASFADNEQLLLSPDYAAEIGVLQMLRSPYFSDRAILAVSGTQDAALERIGAYLQPAQNRWKLTGDAVVLDSRMEIKAFTFLAQEAQEKVSLREQLVQNKSAVVFTLVSTLAMLLLLLAIIMITVRARRHSKEDDK